MCLLYNIIVFKVGDRDQITYRCFTHNNALSFCFNGLFMNNSTSSSSSQNIMVQFWIQICVPPSKIYLTLQINHETCYLTFGPSVKGYSYFPSKKEWKKAPGMFEAKSMKHVSRYTLHLIFPTGHSRACLGWIIYWDVFFYVYICKLNNCRECSYALELHCVFFSVYFLFL